MMVTYVVPGDAGNTGHPQPFTSPAGSCDPASEVWVCGDDHTWQQSLSRGPGLRSLLTEPLYAAGAAEGAWTPMEEAGSSGLCCIRSEELWLQPLCEVPSTHSSSALRLQLWVSQDDSKESRRAIPVFLLS